MCRRARRGLPSLNALHLRGQGLREICVDFWVGPRRPQAGRVAPRVDDVALSSGSGRGHLHDRVGAPMVIAVDVTALRPAPKPFVVPVPVPTPVDRRGRPMADPSLESPSTPPSRPCLATRHDDWSRAMAPGSRAGLV